MTFLEQAYEKTAGQMDSDNRVVQESVESLKALLDCFSAVMEDRPETLTFDADDAYYSYLKDVLDQPESFEVKSHAEKKLIFKARLESGLQRFLRDVGWCH